MNITFAAANYPITEHLTFDAWRAHTEGWIAEAVNQNAQVLLFPEYGSMELVSLFNTEIRSDIRRQVKELDRLKEAFYSVFLDLSKKYSVIIIAPSLPIIDGDFIFNRAYVFSPKGLVGYQDKVFYDPF